MLTTAAAAASADWWRWIIHPFQIDLIAVTAVQSIADDAFVRFDVAVDRRRHTIIIVDQEFRRFRRTHRTEGYFTYAAVFRWKIFLSRKINLQINKCELSKKFSGSYLFRFIKKITMPPMIMATTTTKTIGAMIHKFVLFNTYVAGATMGVNPNSSVHGLLRKFCKTKKNA